MPAEPARARTVRRTVATLVTVAVVVTGAAPGQATAGPDPATAEVAALQRRVDAAAADLDRALDRLSAAVTTDLARDRAAAEARAALAAERAAAASAARALYTTGGPAGVWVTVLTARTPHDLLTRATYAQRLFTPAPDPARARAVLAERTARRAGARVDRLAGSAREVTERVRRLDTLLARSRARLAALSVQASAQAAARQAAAALAATERATATRLQAASAAVPAGTVPPDWARLYRDAAATCPGLPWPVLAAIGQVESGHGRNAGVSSAGAEGPMQFMPGTFAAYGVDADRDGRADPYNPVDAVFSAARYLCALGGGEPARLPDAVFGYNHAQWYVDLVLRLAGELATDLATPRPPAAIM